MPAIPNMQLEKYFVMTIACSECAFKFPMPEEIEMDFQKTLELPGLISMEIDMVAIGKGISACPSCGQPTILQIRAINKNA